MSKPRRCDAIPGVVPSHTDEPYLDRNVQATGGVVLGQECPSHWRYRARTRMSKPLEVSRLDRNVQATGGIALGQECPSHAGATPFLASYHPTPTNRAWTGMSKPRRCDAIPGVVPSHTDEPYLDRMSKPRRCDAIPGVAPSHTDEPCSDKNVQATQVRRHSWRRTIPHRRTVLGQDVQATQVRRHSWRRTIPHQRTVLGQECPSHAGATPFLASYHPTPTSRTWTRMSKPLEVSRLDKNVQATGKACG